MTQCPRCSGPLIRDIGCIVHGEPSVTLAVEHAASLARERAKKRAAQKWTPAEWEFAEASKDRMSGPEIARALTERFGRRRTWKAVKHQFERRKVHKPEVRSATRTVKRKKPVEVLPRSHWRVPEIEALEDGEVTVLVRVRSRDAIDARARRMGTTVRSGDGMLSVRQVAAHYRVHHAVLLQWVARGLLPATRNGDLWRIDPEMAAAIVPLLAKVSRRMSGQRGWWRDMDLLAAIDRRKRRVRALERNVDDLLRPGLVRSEE